MVLILIGGLLLGGRGAAVVTAASIAAVAGVYYGESLGLVHIAFRGAAAMRPWVTYAGLFVLLAFLLQLAVRTINEGYDITRRLLAAERQRARQMELLARIGDLLTREDDPDRLMQEVVRRLSEDSDYGHVGLYLIDGEALILRAMAGRIQHDVQVGERIPLGQGIIGWVGETGRTYWTNDTRLDPKFLPFPAADVRAEAAVPLRLDRHVVGVLNVESERSGVFHETDIRTLESLADLLASGLQSSQLYNALVERERLAEALRRVGLTVSQSLDLPTVLDTLCREAARYFKADGAGVWLLEGDRLQAAAIFGSEQGLGEVRLGQDSDWSAARAMSERRSLFVNAAPGPAGHQALVSQATGAQSLLYTPIVSEERPLGVLVVFDRTNPQRFGPADTAPADLLGAQLAAAVRNAQLYRQSQQRAAQLSILNEIGRAVASRLELDAVLELIYAQVKRVLPVDAFVVSLYDAQTNRVAFPLVIDDNQRYEQPSGPLGADTAVDRVIRSAQPVLLCRTPEEQQQALAQLERRGLGNFSRPSASLLFAPMQVGERVVGVISAQSYQLNAYSAEHLELLMGVAQHAATAIENARLFEAERRRNAEMEGLYAASLALTSRLELQPLFETVLTQALKLVAAQDAHIFLYDEGRLAFGAASWTDGRRAAPFQQPREDGLTYRVARGGQPIVVPDMSADPLFAGLNYGGAIIGLPLQADAQVRGVMNVAFDQPHAFTEGELRLLRLLADQAAIALENARLHAELKEHVRELDALLKANATLLSTLDLDPLLRNVLAAAMAAIPAAEKGTIMLLDRESGLLEIRAAQGYADARVLKSLAPEQGYAVKALRENRPLLVGDARTEADVEFSGGVEEVGAIRSAIVAPLRLGPEAGQQLGAISLDAARPAAFTESDLHLLLTFGQTASAAIDNAGLHAVTKAQAVTDSLTGLANRRAFDQSLQHELARAERYGTPLALLIIDIDSFKLFNDTYGHLAGDERLKATAALLRSKLREPDLAARYGGEEFGVVMPHTGRLGALKLAERLRAAAEASAPPGHAPGSPISGFTLSLGVAVFPEDAQTAEALLLAADNAELAAKRRGKNRVVGANELGG
jgi:diguanylate cyclase (GGDEF)-like protein